MVKNYQLVVGRNHAPKNLKKTKQEKHSHTKPTRKEKHEGLSFVSFD
jgi:hypothetical protein